MINLLIRSPEELESILPKILYGKKEDCKDHKVVYYDNLLDPSGKLLDYSKTGELCSNVPTCLFDRLDKIGGVKVISCDGKGIKMRYPEHNRLGTVLLILKDAELDSTLEFTRYIYDLGIIYRENQHNVFHKIDEVILKDITNVKSVLKRISHEKKEGCYNPKTIYYPQELLPGYKTTKDLLDVHDVSSFKREDKIGAMKIISCDGKEIKVECEEHKHLATVLLILKDVERWPYSTHDAPYITQIFDKGYFCEEEMVFHKLPGREVIGPDWQEID